MSDLAVQVENLSKQYQVGVVKQHYDTLRDRLTAGVRSLPRRKGDGGADRIWALKDVSFQVKAGEVLGIIGRNGSGKSTLLKILARITEPTRGRARLQGRVGSLLEVGAGFHRELTGRENIYLNGVILGMRKDEIDRRFDEIVAFAEVGRFIDMPVKRYSSGMAVRLAFAVAAHVEPEILIVDEVLAVGDASFESKCIGKMGTIAREGRTVLFVSHNMGAVSNLCTSAMWLDGGTIAMRDDVAPTVRAYLKSTTTVGQSESHRWSHSGTGDARITDARLLDAAGNPCTTFCMGETVIAEFDVEFLRDFRSVNFSLEIKRADMGLHVVHLQSRDSGLVVGPITPGRRRFRAEIPNCLLYPAAYHISFRVWPLHGVVLDRVTDAVSFSMVQSDITRRTQPLARHREAIFYQPSKWQEVVELPED
jgi:lipopolysaccharide transport system ATP-binding protein